MELTGAGELFLPLALEIVQKLNEYKAFVSNAYPSKAISGSINIYSTALLYLSLSKISYVFTKLFPNIQLNFKELNFFDIFATINPNGLGIGIIPIMHHEYAQEIYASYFEEFEHYKLMDDQYLCYVHKSSPLANKKIVTAQEFIQHPLIFLDNSTNHPLIQTFRQYGEVKIAVQSNNIRVYTNSLLNPNNVGITSTNTHKTITEFMSNSFRNEFVLIPFEEDFTFDISLIYKHRELNEIEKITIDYLKKPYCFF